MTIRHGFEDPHEMPEDYDGRDEVADFIRWQRWYDEHCMDTHVEFVPVRTVETIDPGTYL